MKPYLNYGVIFLIACGIFLTTCNKDYFELDKLSNEIELEPSLVAPLIYGSMTLNDIVERVDSLGFTRLDKDSLIFIVYEDTAFSVRADTIVEVPDKVNTEYYIDSDVNVPIWLSSNPGDTVPFFKSELFSFELDGNDRVDSILIKGGQIVIDVMSSFEHTGLLTISSSQILDVNRDTFATTIDISQPDGLFTDQQIFLTDGYSLKTSRQADTSYIQINFRLDLINSGNPVNPDDVCEIASSFIDLDFYNVFGYIDSRDLINETGEFDIPLYENNPDLASIIFADPGINIYTSSSIGIPLEIELSNVIATSSKDGSELELTFSGEHPFQIGAPGIDQIGERVNSEIIINKTTSNIDKLLASAPSHITYSVAGRTAADTGVDQHFVLDTSVMDLSMEILLPLDFRSDKFSLQDTFEFVIDVEGLDTSMIKFLQVELVTRNELPIQFQAQGYLLDETYAIVDSIFNGEKVLLEASQVNENGQLVQATEAINSITFPAEKIASLENVAYLNFVATMATSEGGNNFVKLYSYFTLEFELSLNAKARVNTRELN